MLLKKSGFNLIMVTKTTTQNNNSNPILLHSYAYNVYNTGRSEIFTQLNVVVCLYRVERGF